MATYYHLHIPGWKILTPISRENVSPEDVREELSETYKLMDEIEETLNDEFPVVDRPVGEITLSDAHEIYKLWELIIRADRFTNAMRLFALLLAGKADDNNMEWEIISETDDRFNEIADRCLVL